MEKEFKDDFDAEAYQEEFVDMFLDMLPDGNNYPRTYDYYVKMYAYLKHREGAQNGKVDPES